MLNDEFSVWKIITCSSKIEALLLLPLKISHPMLLQVVNSTYALWTWHRNQDNYKENAVGDQIYIVRQPELCMKDLKVLVPY